MTLASNPPSWQIKTVVAATDFLESSRLSLDYAVSFAYRYKAELVLLHSFEMTSAASEAEMTSHRPSVRREGKEQRLEAFADGIRRAGVPVRWELVQGPVADSILKAAKRLNADLLVIGTHGTHRGLDHMLIGSNTEALLLNAPCPTLTVGRHVLGGVMLDIKFNRIIYISDFTPEAVAAAPYALLLGREFGAEVDVCQLLPAVAEDNTALRNDLATQYCEQMKTVLGDPNHAWCATAFQLDRSMATDQLLDRVRSDAAGLIVMGVKTCSQLGRHLHASVAYQLLAKAVCPILTIPSPHK